MNIKDTHEPLAAMELLALPCNNAIIVVTGCSQICICLPIIMVFLKVKVRRYGMVGRDTPTLPVDEDYVRYWRVVFHFFSFLLPFPHLLSTPFSLLLLPYLA